MIHLKKFNENYNEYESEFLLSYSTIWINSEKIIEIPNFTYENYKNYKNDNFIFDYDYYQDMVIEDSNLEWEIVDCKLISNVGIGTEVEIDLIDEFYVDDDATDEDCDNALSWEEQQAIAIEQQGLEWEIIENENHPNVIRRKNLENFNI